MLGMRNSKHNFFNLSVMVDSPQPQIISFMIYLACIVGNLASHDNFWYQLIMQPRSIASCNVPYTRFKNVQENESSSTFSVIPNVSGNILQLFLHSSLVLSLELETTSLESFKNSVGFDCADVSDYLEMQLRQYWHSLESGLQLTSNDLCILLHSILFKSLSLFTVKYQCADVKDVKDAYTRLMTDQECIIQQIVMDRYTIIHESKQHSASLYDRSETSIENCVLEITPCQSSSNMNFVTQLFTKIQNNFLCLAHSLKSIKETSKTVPLPDIRSKDLLRFERNDCYLQFSQCDSRYGLSQKIDFDYEKIEQEIQAEVLIRKCLIDVQVLSKITFTDNLFRNTVELLMDLQSKMYQYPLTTDIKKEVVQKSERDASLTSDMLTHTGIILSLIRKTGAQSEQPIFKYLRRWETVLGISSLELKNIFPEDIKIGHIIPFYQWLEELNGENLANSLGDTYLLQLPREGRDCLLRFSKSNMKSIEKLSHAVKVFVQMSFV
ncbi:unnamed protein product [Mytilus coruscus]|uniref:Uncharacterized protein n=1 Tax=Mytilus coruscus TaxID=42192 RepID=A0A6J8AQA4_MYTCO|nr:unnamed protein product [Mytilus coruscus]